jgi:hypothetical protein
MTLTLLALQNEVNSSQQTSSIDYGVKCILDTNSKMGGPVLRKWVSRRP